VPRVLESELLEIQMMAELVTKGAQERSERRDFLANRRSHPYANQHGPGCVVAKEFVCPVPPGAERSRGKYADAAGRDFVEIGCILQKFRTGAPNVTNAVRLHRGFQPLHGFLRMSILRQVESFDSLAF